MDADFNANTYGRSVYFDNRSCFRMYNLCKTKCMDQIVCILLNEEKAYLYYRSQYQFRESELEQIKKIYIRAFCEKFDDSKLVKQSLW